MLWDQTVVQRCVGGLRASACCLAILRKYLKELFNVELSLMHYKAFLWWFYSTCLWGLGCQKSIWLYRNFLSFNMNDQRLQDHICLFLKNLIVLINSFQFKQFPRLLDLVFEIYQLFKSVIEKNNFLRRFMRQSFPNVLKTFGIFQDCNYECLNVLNGPDISLFVLHFVVHWVVDLLEAWYDLDYWRSVSIDVVRGFWYLNVGISCAIDILRDLRPKNSLRVGSLYWNWVQITWSERELCDLLLIEIETVLLQLALKMISYSFFVQFWVCLLKLIVILKNLIALRPFCLQFALFKQFGGLN